MKLTSKNLLAVAPLVIIIVAVVFGLFGLSMVFAASRAGEVNLISPRVNVAATAQSIRLDNRRTQLEAASQQRIATIEAQIEQAEQSLELLQRTEQTQTIEQQKQLAALEQQVEQKQSTVESLHASVIQLKQELMTAGDDFQARLATVQAEGNQAEAELEAELEAVNQQLATANPPPSDPAEFTDDDDLPQIVLEDGDDHRDDDGGSSDDHHEEDEKDAENEEDHKDEDGEKNDEDEENDEEDEKDDEDDD